MLVKFSLSPSYFNDDHEHAIWMMWMWREKEEKDYQDDNNNGNQTICCCVRSRKIKLSCCGWIISFRLRLFQVEYSFNCCSLRESLRTSHVPYQCTANMGIRIFRQKLPIHPQISKVFRFTVDYQSVFKKIWLMTMKISCLSLYTWNFYRFWLYLNNLNISLVEMIFPQESFTLHLWW